MRILVTGGAGFIGSAVTDAYLAAGHDVAVVDDLSAGSPDNLDPRARLYRVDVRQPALDDVFADERPEIIYRDEEPGVPADETRPCRPRTPYAVAKCSVEQYLDCFSATFGLEAVALRYANVYGPRQDPHGEAGVIAIFLQRILAGVAPTIFGDGEQVRDFIYVADVAAANLGALEAPASPGEALVLNTGIGTTVNTVWRTIERITTSGVRVYHEPARSGDVRWNVLDSSRAQRTLQWAPAVPVDDGLRSTWEWFAMRASGQAEVA